MKTYKQLAEAVRGDRLLHFTRSAVRILGDGEFRTSSMSKMEADKAGVNLQKNERYISFARTMQSTYIGPRASSGTDLTMAITVFEMDGAALRRDYKVKSFNDFAGLSKRLINETEDRLFTNDRGVPIKYVKALHVYMHPLPDAKEGGDSTIENMMEYRESVLDELSYAADKRNIPLFYYENKKDWLNLRWTEAEEVNAPEETDHE